MRSSERCFRFKSTDAAFRIFLGVFSLILTFSFVVMSERSRSVVSAALDFCVSILIPSLFPFMIASRLLVKCGFGRLCEKLFGGAFKKLFGLGGAGASALFLGAIAGFPIGAKMICELRKSKGITASDAENLLALCSNAGVGFTVSVIGAVMWKSVFFGFKIWLICLCSSLLCGIFEKRNNAVNHGTETISEDLTMLEEKNVCGKDEKASKKGTENENAAAILVNSVVESAVSMLNICAFAVFFELVASLLAIWISPFVGGAEEMWIGAVFTAFLEFSSGAYSISAAVFSPLSSASTFTVGLAKILTSITVAWSGMSVHAQVASFALPLKLSMKKYFIMKVKSSVIAALISLLCIAFSLL